MEHHNSILYGPVNALWNHRFGFDIPDHVVMALLVLVISSIMFPLAARGFSRENPGRFQQFLELIVDGLRGLLEDIVGHGASHRFLYIIGGFAVFIFMSNMFGLFYFLQPPTGNVNTTYRHHFSRTGIVQINPESSESIAPGNRTTRRAMPSN